MDSLFEFLSRCIGPFLFVAGMAMTLAGFQASNNYIVNAQEEYVKDDAYSQGFDKVFNNKVSKDAIIGILVNGSSVDVCIDLSDQVSENHRIIDVKVLQGSQYSVKITEVLTADVTKRTTVYNKTISGFQGFVYNGFSIHGLLPSGLYEPTYSYASNGSLKQVIYRIVEGE